MLHFFDCYKLLQDLHIFDLMFIIIIDLIQRRKRMKKGISILLCFTLICAMLAGCGKTAEPAAAPEQETTEEAESGEKTEEAATEQADSETELPAVGDEISGFVVTKLIPMDAIGAEGVVFEHAKSGATLLYLANEDTNCAFDITFKTPALDDKGKPHVFEHITICGSQKYPDANMFIPVMKQTYNTFINACTFHGMTSFPMSSRSEKQLTSMMDYYLSGVFDPLLYSEPKLAEREAWRYELTDADADLNIAGTVYSEMQGASSLVDQAQRNNIRTLYQGSTTAYESGGVPKDIRTLTAEELIAFHDTYYHPSNALIFLYGKLDWKSMLSHMDSEYLSKYDKKDIQVDQGTIEPFTETNYAEYDFPVEKNASTKNASVLCYSIALNGAELYDLDGITFIRGILSQESSPLMRKLREKLPGAKIQCDVNFDCPSAPYLAVFAIGVNPEDQDIFVEAVEDGLQEFSEEGITEEALDAELANQKLSLLSTLEAQDGNIYALFYIALGWTYYNDLEYYPTFEKAVEDMTVESANAMVQKYLTDNPHRAVSLTKPKAGLTEENAAALQKELQEKKDSMTEEEIATLVENSSAFIDWTNEPVSEEILSKITNLEIADLPEELDHYEIEDETVDGVRYMKAAVDIEDIYSGAICLDGSTIPIDQLQDAQLCLILMGQLDSANYDKEEFSLLITRYLDQLSMGLVANGGYADTPDRYMANISWRGLEEDAGDAVALLREMLLETDYSDTKEIKNILTRMSSQFAVTLDSNVNELQQTRCEAMYNTHSAYNVYTDGYAFYQHEQELIALADSDPKALTARLEEAAKLLSNKTGAVVLIAGGEKANAACQENVEKFMADMSEEQRPAVDYSSLCIPKRNEGIVNNSTVQMNFLMDRYEGYNGKSAVLNGLIDDSYMFPKLRNGLGAYGAYSCFAKNSAFLFTYRDPNLASTYDIFAALPEYLRTTEWTQDMVDAYVIGGYSALTRAKGPVSSAMDALKMDCAGYTEAVRLQWLKDAKNTTPEDVKAAADEWEKLISSGSRSSSGTESTLMEEAELFDVLIYPDGSEKVLNQ